jgi:hypothetical protein
VLHNPGDFAAVTTDGNVGNWIHIGEILASGTGTNYEHAILWVGGPDNLILEAEPGGAELRPFHYAETLCLWSTGIASLALSAQQQAEVMGMALALKGTPYAFSDYAAIAAHKWHIPAPGLKDYIKSSDHMICSQLVDRARWLLGSHLFSDNRWPGYVMPVDLANLILNARALM